MNRLATLSFAFFLFAIALSIGACGGGSQGGGGTTQNPTTPTVTVKPGSNSITTAQSLSVTVAVSGSNGTPTGSVVLSSGTYTSAASTLGSGSATVTIPAGSLAAGSDTLTAKYTPDGASSSAYNAASGSAPVTVTTPTTTPTVTVTPASNSITAAQSLSVTITVAGTGATPTGSVVLSSGSYMSAAATLSSGSANITIPAGSLATGSDMLTAKYTPDSASSGTYNSASGTAPVTVTASSGTAVAVNIDVLGNRHTISPYVYGGNVSSASTVSDSGTTLGRWGGNASSTYNWQLHTYNADADYYFEDFNTGGSGNESDSVQFITDVQNAGANVVMTMPMLGWVAQSAENGSNGHWSFSVATYGAQCAVDPYNADAGDGLETDCQTPVTTNAVTTAYYPLLDSSSQSCPSGNCVYREPWAQALAGAFTSNTCSVPYSTITSCHFYDMDNEVDIWSGTHRDVHPVASGYDELANDFETEAGNMKTWDPAAVRFGPVSCCWWFYWNVGPSGDDKTAHGGVDFLPWWLNQIHWHGSDQRIAHPGRFRYPRVSRCEYLGPHHRAIAGPVGGYLSRLLGSDLRKHFRNHQPGVRHQHSAQQDHSVPHSAHEGHGQRHLSRHARSLSLSGAQPSTRNRTSPPRWEMLTPTASSGARAFPLQLDGELRLLAIQTTRR